MLADKWIVRSQDDMNLTEEKKTPLRIQDIEKKRRMLSMHSKGSAPVRLSGAPRAARREYRGVSRRAPRGPLTAGARPGQGHVHRQSQQPARCSRCI